jgi:hypothetical protein
MLRRFFIIALLLCLPLRLWAGVGMMMNMPAAPVQAAAVQSTQEAPCHEAEVAHDGQSLHQHHSAAHGNESASASTAQAGAQDACDHGQCASCVACHLLALQATAYPSVLQAAPRAWSLAPTGALYATHVPGLFKPPVF